MTNPDRRQELAREWISSVAELRALTDPDNTSRTRIERVKGRLGARRSEARARELRRGLHSTKQHMEYLSLGADPRKWGVLSGGQLDGRRGSNGCFLLEDTLETLAWPSETTPDTVSQARRILDALPEARSNAELGCNSAVAVIEKLVLSLAESPELEPRQRRRLLDHLPARLRPLPNSLEALERGQPPVTLYLDLQGEDMPYSHPSGPRIRLHDIVVANGLQGKGLGTATLTELCRYSDLHGLPIEGMLEPGARASDETLVGVAKWYMRMGFTQGDREPRHWRRGGIIRRAPNADSQSGSWGDPQ